MANILVTTHVHISIARESERCLQARVPFCAAEVHCMAI